MTSRQVQILLLLYSPLTTPLAMANYTSVEHSLPKRKIKYPVISKMIRLVWRLRLSVTIFKTLKTIRYVSKTRFASYQCIFWWSQRLGSSHIRIVEEMPKFPTREGNIISFFSLKRLLCFFLVCSVFNCNCVCCLFILAFHRTTCTITRPYQKIYVLVKPLGKIAATPELPSSKVVEVPTPEDGDQLGRVNNI